MAAARFSRNQSRPTKKKIEPWRSAQTATVDCKGAIEGQLPLPDRKDREMSVGIESLVTWPES